MYLVIFEGRGNGSCNFCGDFVPAINVFTNKKLMLKALRHYFYSNNELCEDDDISSVIDNVIAGGIFQIDEYKWLRIKEIESNPDKLNNKLEYPRK